MLIVVLLAIGLTLRPERYVEVLALGAAVFVPPWVTLAVCGVLAVRVRMTRSDPYEEVVFLQGLAAELRAGHSVRQAIISGAERAPSPALGRAARLAAAGRPMDEVADELEIGLPASGGLAAIALRIGTESGGRMAAVFSTLAGIQSDAIDLGREVRSATANVRASVMFIGGLPVGGLGLAAATGRLSEIVSYGASGALVVGAGVVLLLAGAGSILAMARTVAL